MKKQYINRKGELVTLDLDDNAPVPPDHGVRVSMMLMDSMDNVQKAIASTTNVRVTDSAGRPAGSRPGFCFNNDTDAEALAQKEYSAAKARIQDAYRGATTTQWPGAASNLRGAWHNLKSPAPPVDRTTAESTREHYKTVLSNSWRSSPVSDAIAPVSDQRPVTEDDLEADRERRKHALSNAWRTKGTGFGPGSFGAA